MTKKNKLEEKLRKLEKRESELLKQLETLKDQEFIMTIPIEEEGETSGKRKSV